MDKAIVAIFGIGGIALTYWFFLMKKEDEAVAVGTNAVDIIVEGGYSPSVVAVSRGKPVTLNFIRKDPSSCLEEVVIPEFKIRAHLPLNQKTPVVISPKKEGTYEISCGMNMFHGKIIVT